MNCSYKICVMQSIFLISNRMYLRKTLRQRKLRLVGHALRMANPLTLAIILSFLQPRHPRRRAQARTLTFHQDIIDDITASIQSVRSMTSATKTYFNRIVATRSISLERIIYIYIGWAKSMVTVNVKCLIVKCDPTFGPPCM